MLEGGFGSLGKNDGDGEDGEEDRGGATEGVGQVALDDVLDIRSAEGGILAK